MNEYPAPDLNLMSGPISIATSVLIFLIYLFIIKSDGSNKRFQNKFSPTAASVRKVLYHRLTGATLFGLIPVLIIVLVFQRPLNQYGFDTGSMMKSFLWWIPVAALVVVVSYLGARHENNLAMYPQIRVSLWNRGLLAVSVLSWIVYLTGYEFLLRGYLLFSCLESFGYWPAIIINICIYSLFHVHKGSREIFGSVLVGFLLCYLTLYLGSFWFALYVHVTMALSNEWFSLGFQPDMKIVKYNRKK